MSALATNTRWNRVLWKQVQGNQLDWVIVGGESGPSARPMEFGWAQRLQQQCAVAGTRFFMKQLSKSSNRATYKDFDSFPADLRVREMPGSV